MKYKEFMSESPKQIVDVVFGDSKRLGQSRLMGLIIGTLTKDKNNPSPVFGLATATRNLQKAGVKDSDVQLVRNAVIKGMQNTIKKEKIPQRFIEDLPERLFERYRFFLDDYAPHPGAIDLIRNDRLKVYKTARKLIEVEIAKLDIQIQK